MENDQLLFQIKDTFYALYEKIFSIDTILKLLNILLILIIGLVFSRMTTLIATKLLTVPKTTISIRKQKTLLSIVCSIIKYSVNFIVIFTVLVSLGVDPISILTLVSVFSVSIGLGAQTFVKDIITGFFILLEDQFGVGDAVTIDSRSGIVENMGLRTTSLRNADGSLHIIPNSEIKIVTNMSKGFSRAILDITVPYQADTDTVLTILKNEVAKHAQSLQGILTEPTVLGVTKMGAGIMEIRIVADCTVGKKDMVERELRRILKQRLTNEGIV